MAKYFSFTAGLLMAAINTVLSLFNMSAGMFAAPSVRWQTFIEVLFMQDNGIFGPTAGVAASYLMIFLVFGAMLVRTNGIEFFGHSFIADPFGRIIAEAGEQQTILLARVDPALIETVRRNWPFLRDRRIDAYGPILNRWLDR